MDLVLLLPVVWFFFVLFVAWILIWKGIALWRAARNHHTVWFVVLLILNTLGILEIIYILCFSRKKHHKNNKPTKRRNGH
jgi:hypothetical protein